MGKLNVNLREKRREVGVTQHTYAHAHTHTANYQARERTAWERLDCNRFLPGNLAKMRCKCPGVCCYKKLNGPGAGMMNLAVEVSCWCVRL